MLMRKMLRDMRSSFAQFFSIFILAAVAMWCYTGFQANVIGGGRAREEFEKKTNFSDGWIYGAAFDEDRAEAVKAIDDVNDVQLRSEVLGKADEKYNTAELYCYFQDTKSVTVPFVINGVEFDPSDEDGVWLFYRFADAWGLSVGDSFTSHVLGQDITKTIRGLIATPEYEFACASTDADTDFHNIGFAYMSVNVLPEELRGFNEIIFTCKGDPLKLEDDISSALDGNYAFLADRKSIDGYNRLTDELSQHDGFSYVFSAIFVAIALLVIITTMKRMVAHQRTQIGTLNALGMKKRKIMTHYISFSVIITALGCLVGVILGIFTFGKMMVDIFSDFYSVPGWEPGYDAKSVILSLIIVLICALAAFLSCKTILKIHPSEALRPAAAKTSKPCIFERLPFWGRLSFTAKYDLRDIARSKLRAVMGICGTMMGMIIMLMGIGAYDTVEYVKDWYFKDIQNYDSQVLFTDSCTPDQAFSIADKYSGELISADLISIAAEEHPTSDDIVSCKLTVTEGKGLFCVSDTDLNVTDLEPGTVALTMKQARKIGLEKGDTVYWKRSSDNTWNKSRIGFISRHPSIMGITMLRADYESLGFEFKPQMLVSKQNCDSAEDLEFVSAVHSMSDLRAAFDKSMEIMDLLVYFMIFFACLLIIVVLYNSGNLSFNEREKEFATLKVLGFKSGAIRKLISVQNLWLSIIGVIIGIPLGQAPLQAMMDSNGDQIDWPCYVSPITYLISGAFVMAVSVIVGFMFQKRIKRINMIEVLKGME